MTCPVCKAENLQGAKFCNECGLRLEVLCPFCQAPSAAGAKFCSDCGSNLDFRCTQCSSANRPGANYCQQCGVRLVTACYGCHSPTPPGARFCQECGARLERRCSQCGTPLLYNAKFCNGCGGALAEVLAATLAPPVAPRVAPPAPVPIVPIIPVTPRVAQAPPPAPVAPPVTPKAAPPPTAAPAGETPALPVEPVPVAEQEPPVPEPPTPDGGAPKPAAPAAPTRTAAPDRGPAPAQPLVASAVAVAEPPVTAPPIEVTPAPKEDERRLVTVLFGDVSGFTAMSEKLDPEEMKMIMDRCLKGLADQVFKFEGTVDKFEGDLIMAVYGAPIAHEDDAERAVLTAIDMQEFLTGFSADLQRRRGFTLKMRIGVNTGEVISGTVGSGRDKDYTVMGDVVNTASRFESNAEPGTVLVGAKTWSLTKHMIEYQELESIFVKGKVDALQVYRPLSVKKERGQRRGVEGLESPMVGRGEELDTLINAFTGTMNSTEPHLVTVMATAGMGKSRLLNEFEQYLKAGQTPYAWYKGRCVPYGQGIAFYPLAEILKSFLAIKESDALESVQQRLLDGVREVMSHQVGQDSILTGQVENPPYQLEAVQVAHRLGYTIGISFPESDLAGINPANLKDELYWGWRKFLSAWSKTAPLVLVVEDMHWADELVIRLVGSVVDSLEGAILFLCITRPDLVEQNPDWGKGQRRSSVEIKPLSRDETIQLLDNLLSPNILSRAWKDKVAEAAGGVPYYVEECLRILIEDGRLVRSPAGWAPSDSERLPELPDSIFATLSARLDRLPSIEKTVLQRAAVVGTSFWESALAYPAMHLGAEADALEVLHARGWVQPVAESSFEGDPEFAFSNPLVRDSAYRGLTRVRRSREHLRVAEWIEWKVGERLDESVELLSYHFGQGILQSFDDGEGDISLPIKAGAYSWRAAERARLQQAFNDALGRYDTTCAVLDRLARMDGGDTAEVDGRPVHVLRAEVLLGRARVKEPLGQYDSALADLEEVVSAAGPDGMKLQAAAAHSHKARVLRLQGQPVTAIESAELAIQLFEGEGDALGQAQSLMNLGEIYSDQARMADFETMARKAVDLARTAEVGWAEARALTLLGSACIYQGKMAEALDYLRLGVERYQSDRRGAGSTLLLLGRVLHAAGESAEAIERLEHAFGIFQELGDQNLRTAALSTLGQLYLERGELAAARDYSERGAALAKLLGLAVQELRCLLLLSQAGLAEGQAREAVDRLLEAKQTCEGSDQAAILPEIYRMLAQAYLQAGEPEVAEEYALKGREAVEEEDTYSQGTTWFALALVQAGLQRPVEAEETFAHALKDLEESGETYEIGEAHLEFAAFLLKLDRKDEAKEHLSQAREAFQSLETKDRLERIEALQSQLT